MVDPLIFSVGLSVSLFSSWTFYLSLFLSLAFLSLSFLWSCDDGGPLDFLHRMSGTIRIVCVFIFVMDIVFVFVFVIGFFVFVFRVVL